jgi:hypothetical protein
MELPDKLLDQIYDAATEEDLWTPALIQIADMTGSLVTTAATSADAPVELRRPASASQVWGCWASRCPDP